LLYDLLLWNIDERLDRTSYTIRNRHTKSIYYYLLEKKPNIYWSQRGLFV